MAEVSVDQFLANLKKLAADIKKNGIKIAETMAITGKSLVQERIQKEGFGAEYSKRYIPAWWLRGKERNAGGRRYLEENNLDDDLVNWSEFRQAQGLQNDFVDLTYSGRMFGGMRVIERKEKGTTYMVNIGGSDQEVDKKLGWNTERYGDFMQPNESEQAEVDQIVELEFDKLIKKYFR